MQKNHIKQEDLEKIIAAKCILEKEYYRHYTHEELAQMVGTNEHKLKTGFKDVTNKCVYEYLTCIRIEKAKELLENTELPLKIIARKLGLDKSNLNKCFKKLTGNTPMEWRKGNSGYYNKFTGGNTIN